MADKLNDNGVYVFDQESPEVSKYNGSSSNKKGAKQFFKNRYSIITMGISAIGIVILGMTASLQFSGYIPETAAARGSVSREYSVPAPRGEIVDSNGVVLASSRAVKSLLLATAYDLGDINTKKKDKSKEQIANNAEFNQMLLDLSYLFDEYNVTPIEELSDYLSVEPFAFKKDEEEILQWQVNKNLFALEEPPKNKVVTYQDKKAKNDPQIFFLYLRNLFDLDESYSTEEAYRIIKLRYQIFKDNWAFTTGKPVKVAINVPEELIDLILEQNYKYKGVIVSQDYRRIYSPQAQLASHVIGYVGKIPQDELTNLQTMGYTSEDILGMSGVEKQMERYLHGTNGTSSYNVWTDKQAEGSFYPESIGTAATAGASVKLTLDSELQQVALDSIKDYIQVSKENEEKKPENERFKTANAGAVVAMDPKTGAILAMASFPDYDPNDFVLAMEGDEAAKDQVNYYLGLGDEAVKARTAEDMPLWNRSLLSRYAPGSTYKMVTAVAGLETGEITPDKQIICESPVDLGGWKFYCLEEKYGGHGPLTLNEAMATSCNIYFQKLGMDVGINAMDEWGKKLGLGELSGIDLPGEIPGFRSSRETKKLLRQEEYDKQWFPADTAQSAIGQFDHSYTILQLARYTATLATNQLVTPHVISEVTAQDGSILYQGSKDSVPAGLSESTISAIREAMTSVVTDKDGTAKKYLGDFPFPVAAKTGTAETGYEDVNKEYSNGLFVCYAPADDPQIAIALVVERGEWGKQTIVIARNLMLAYFGMEDPQADAPAVSEPLLGDILTPTPTTAAVSGSTAG